MGVSNHTCIMYRAKKNPLVVVRDTQKRAVAVSKV
jgi:hypothetical protein